MGGRLDGRNKMKTFLVGLAALAIGASLTFVACGGDDSTSNTKTASTTAGDTKTDSPTTTGAAAATTTTGGSGSAQVTGSGADALKNLAKDLSKKTYQVSYDLETTSADGKTTKNSITLSQKPPKTATSFSSGAAAGGSFVIINDGTNTLTCSGTASAGQCSKAKTDPSSPFAGNGFSLDKTLQGLTDSVNITETDGRKVAGADSRCFTIKQSASADSLACFSKSDGIATYVENKGTTGTLTKITATKISNSVDDSAFAAPAGYKVVDAPQ
jgi:hypothetical protein